MESGSRAFRSWVTHTHQVAIITGASRGVGAAAAQLMAAAGATVVLAARTKHDIENIAAQIRQNGGKALSLATDISDPEQVNRLIEATISAYQKIINPKAIYAFLVGNRL